MVVMLCEPLLLPLLLLPLLLLPLLLLLLLLLLMVVPSSSRGAEERHLETISWHCKPIICPGISWRLVLLLLLLLLLGDWHVVDQWPRAVVVACSCSSSCCCCVFSSHEAVVLLLLLPLLPIPQPNWHRAAWQSSKRHAAALC
jgi:hypothetical protein